MGSKLQSLAGAWARRTPREQLLATAVVGLLAVFAVLVCARGALRTIDAMDAEISRLQSDIVNYSHQIARRQAVEARYREVATQHSSAWSESEIRDRLRQEIYRLRYVNPPRLDINGIPVSTESDGEVLVQIPELRGGQLVEGGDGFRAFQLEFEVEPAPFPDMLAYLEFLQGSPQSLRIDRINLRRDPHRPEVDARIQLTRVVVDDPSGGSATVHTSASVAQELRADEWTCAGCTAASVVEAGDDVLRFVNDDGAGQAQLRRSLQAGGVYLVQAEISADTDVALYWQHGPAPAQFIQSIPGTGHYRRVQLQFRVPSEGAARYPVSVPLLVWEAPRSTVKIRGLQYAVWEEVADDS